MIKKILKHLLVVIKSWYWYFKFSIRQKIYKYTPICGEDGITLVITACNRPDKLITTLESFKKNCQIDFNKIIFIEDGGSVQSIEIASKFFKEHNNFISILNSKNLGQLNSIDIAYSYVETEWIFHLEEDWTFTRSGFIEESIELMKSDPKILFLSLRSTSDQNKHPLKKYRTGLLTYKPFWKMVWIGFGFNPSVRRLSHYRLIGSSYGNWNRRETSIGLYYYFKGYRAVVKSDDSYCIIHNGGDCSTELLYNKA